MPNLKIGRKPTGRKIVKPAPQQNQRKKLVEEFARVDAEVNLFKPVLSRHEKLRTLILDWYPDLPPEEEQLVTGQNHDIIISSRDQMRTVTDEGKQKLFKLWGPRGFIAKSTVFLKSLPDPKDELSLYSLKALTGPRHLTVRVREAATGKVRAA